MDIKHASLHENKPTSARNPHLSFAGCPPFVLNIYLTFDISGSSGVAYRPGHQSYGQLSVRAGEQRHPAYL